MPARMDVSDEKVRQVLESRGIRSRSKRRSGRTATRSSAISSRTSRCRTPLELASQQLLKSQICEALGKLTERERKIIVLRFGLEDGRFRTLEEVGREFGITRERIRQIEAKALRKLRHPSYSRKLRGYLE